VYSLKDVSDVLGRQQREVRTLILARNIPTVKIGIAFGVDEAGLKALRAAFVELDRSAKARGMKVAAAV
jgi:hypothetical protein